MNTVPRTHIFAPVFASVAAIMAAGIAVSTLAMLIPDVSPETAKA